MQITLWWISIIKETVDSSFVSMISWLKTQQTQWMIHESESRWESCRQRMWSLKKRFSLWHWMSHMIKHHNQSALSKHQWRVSKSLRLMQAIQQAHDSLIRHFER